jgi:hypothetical protein
MLTIGESGKLFYVATEFDMSANTELEVVFTKPGGGTVTKSKTGGEVVLGTSDGSFPGVGAVLANEYMIYTVEVGFFDTAADSTDENPWKAFGRYTNDATTPDQIYIGLCIPFTVLAQCP